MTTTSEIVGDVISTVSKIRQQPQTTTSQAAAGSSLLVVFKRSSPIRVKDFSAAAMTSTTGLARYCSPLSLTFHDRSTRHKFVRNVFAVLTLQYCFITGMCLTAEFSYVCK